MATDGFTLTEAKCDATYLDDDTVLFATDFGKGSADQFGLCRASSSCGSAARRSQPPRRSMKARPRMCGSSPAIFHARARRLSRHRVRAVSFFENEYFCVDAGRRRRNCRCRVRADLQGRARRPALIATLREDWTPDGDAPSQKGALVAFPLNVPEAGKRPGQLLYAPGPRASDREASAPGGDAVYAAIYRQCGRQRCMSSATATATTGRTQTLALPRRRLGRHRLGQ